MASIAPIQAMTIDEVQAFLADYLNQVPLELAFIGEGAWSRCFGFRHDDEAWVIRFGHYVEDFKKDRRAFHFATPDLPIPKVIDVGSYADGYYAISTRVHGQPLEHLGRSQWRVVVPSLVAAMEAMRTADLSETVGVGGWSDDGNGWTSRWSEQLQTVAKDTADQRTHGWRKRLAEYSPQADVLFNWGYDLLKKVAIDSVPRSLIHGDLINRNVLVQNGKISGIFDWGCSLYGDHLYELAWFEFWAPWSPQQDIPFLRLKLEERWREIGYGPENKEARLRACYLHIGLDHLAYNAYLGDWTAFSATAERMQALVVT